MRVIGEPARTSHSSTGDLFPRVQGDPSAAIPQGPAPAAGLCTTPVAGAPVPAKASERSCSAVPAEADHAVATSVRCSTYLLFRRGVSEPYLGSTQA